MSWDRFFKTHQAQVGRNGVLSKSENREFVREAKKLEQLDDCTRILHKDAKHMSEVELGLLRMEQKIAADLATSTQSLTDTSMLPAFMNWKVGLKEQEEILGSMIDNSQKALLEPLKRLMAVFPSVQASIKKRDQLLTEYQRWQTKVEKYQKKERTGQNIVKLNEYKKNLADAKEEFEAQNNLLLTEMPKLFESRSQYLQPSLRAYINLQLTYLGHCYKNYTELRHNLNQEEVDGPSTGRLDERLSELRSLSIVSPD